MSHATSINSVGNRINPLCRPETARPGGETHLHWRWTAPSGQGRSEEDTVELSAHALWMQELASLPPGRIDVVSRVRAQIGAGTYETEFKIDAALERLAGDVM